jgi:uncharacterized membrane protein
VNAKFAISGNENYLAETIRGHSGSLSMRKSSGKVRTEEDRLSAWITDVLGSFGFLMACIALIVLYFLWNAGLLGLQPLEHFPFGGLELAVSIFAIFLSVAVLISQHRQRKLEKIREQVEFEINVKAESEITKVLQMLEAIQQKLGINVTDAELEEMKKGTDLEHLHQKARRTNDS